QAAAGDAFTIGSNLTVLGKSGTIGRSDGPVFNAGTIQATNGAAFAVPGGLTNTGAVWVLGSTSSLTVSNGALPGGTASPASGLAGWWTGDGLTTDLAGTNTGTLQGGATATAAGKFGPGFTLN